MSLSHMEKLTQVVKALRDPETGCPWDLEQTHESLIKYLIEESFEFKEAVQTKNTEAMKDELGDILLQVLLHTQLASEKDLFNLEDVAKNLSEKLIRRHPHVFANPEQKKITANEVNENWHKIKQEERGQKVTRAIKQKILYAPALQSAHNIGKKTEKLNFDWENASQVAWKVEEEWQELKEELAPGQINKDRVAEELGDFLFSAAQLARHLGRDPEELLELANKKFLKRFYQMEDLITEEGKNFQEMTQQELDHYWTISKSMESK